MQSQSYSRPTSKPLETIENKANKVQQIKKALGPRESSWPTTTKKSTCPDNKDKSLPKEEKHLPGDKTSQPKREKIQEDRDSTTSTIYTRKVIHNIP
jgi:hypothetical protein